MCSNIRSKLQIVVYENSELESSLDNLSPFTYENGHITLLLNYRM